MRAQRRRRSSTSTSPSSCFWTTTGRVVGVRARGPATGGSATSAAKAWCSPRAASRAIPRCSRNISASAPSSSGRWRAAATTTRAKASAWRWTIGAAPAGDFGSFHAEPVDPRSREADAADELPYGILVNADGRRFIDEAPAADATILRRHLARHRRAAGRHRPCHPRREHRRRSELAAHHPHRPAADRGRHAARSLPAKIDIAGGRARKLPSTNTMPPAAPARSSRSRRTGWPPRNLLPPKSNWARRSSRRRIAAYPIIAPTSSPSAGSRSNTEARRCSTPTARPIPGLYAAGETMGLYHRAMRARPR